MWNNATLSPTTKGLETTLHKGLHQEKCYTTQRSAAGDTGAAGAGGTAGVGAGGTRARDAGGTGAAGPGGARTGGTGAAGAGGAAGVGAGGTGVGAAGGTRAEATGGTGAAGPGGACTGGIGAAGAGGVAAVGAGGAAAVGAGDPGAGGTRAGGAGPGGAGAVGAGSRDTGRTKSPHNLRARVIGPVSKSKERSQDRFATTQNKQAMQLRAKVVLQLTKVSASVSPLQFLLHGGQCTSVGSGKDQVVNVDQNKERGRAMADEQRRAGRRRKEVKR
ncbi:unnamed protein product [Closterium sp. NIES-53]